MADIIKFPYTHASNMTLDTIHEMVDDFPSEDEIEACMIVVITKSKNILTCYDAQESVKCLGALEVLKNNIINNMS